MSLRDLIGLLGGVSILIYGIKIMGDALQEIAGDNMRRLLASLVSTPIKGVAAGTLVTMIIQSSSATTVMVVSFVHAGLMDLAQGFSVVMGANIGTTITAQLIAFSIKEYSIIAAVIGAFFFVAGRTERRKQVGAGLVGFALIFIGMAMMQDAMAFLRGRSDWFVMVNDRPILGLLVGAAVTMLIQASAATVGLTMAMASEGLLGTSAAIAIILGDNIGTTITAVIASLGGNRAAKQAAAAHVLFNLIGAVIMMALLTPFRALVEYTSSDIARQVANAHSLFNILNTMIFIPFTRPYTEFIKRLLPDDHSSALLQAHGTKYLDDHLMSVSPAAAVDAVRKEMVALGWIAYEMIKNCYNVIVDQNAKVIPDVFAMEKTINEQNRAIINYSMRLGQRTLSQDLSMLLNSCTSGAADIERIGDHGENIVELAQYMSERKEQFSQKAILELQEMFGLVLTAIEKSVSAIETEDYALGAEVEGIEPKIDQMEKVLRARHIERLNSGKCSPSAAVVFIDILSNLERVGDHANNLSLLLHDLKVIRSK